MEKVFDGKKDSSKYAIDVDIYSSMCNHSLSHSLVYIHTHTHTPFPSRTQSNRHTLSRTHAHTHTLRKYRFPSLFAVDTYFLFWTILKPRIKRTNIKLKLKGRLFQKGSFGPRISEIADKKNENNEGHLYFLLLSHSFLSFLTFSSFSIEWMLHHSRYENQRLLNNLSWRKTFHIVSLQNCAAKFVMSQVRMFILILNCNNYFLNKTFCDEKNSVCYLVRILNRPIN